MNATTTKQKPTKLIKQDNTKLERIKNILDENNKYTDKYLSYYEGLSEIEQLAHSLMNTAKIRRDEFPLIKKVTKKGKEYYIHLKNGLKGSKAIRQLAPIKPFIGFIESNFSNIPKWIKELGETIFLSKNEITKFFKVLKEELDNKYICPRSFEYATMTYLSSKGKGNKALSKISGHKTANNANYYKVPKDLNPETLMKNLEGEFKLLGQLEISTTNTLYEALQILSNESFLHINELKEENKKLKEKVEGLESKIDKILSLVESIS